MNEVRGEMRVS